LLQRSWRGDFETGLIVQTIVIVTVQSQGASLGLVHILLVVSAINSTTVTQDDSQQASVAQQR
jgi:hypothetical protein